MLSTKKQLENAREKLTKLYAKARKERYELETPKDPAVFSGILMTLKQRNSTKDMTAREQKLYAEYLRTPITQIRRWAMTKFNMPRTSLTGENAYTLQVNIMQYHHRRSKWFIKQLIK